MSFDWPWPPVYGGVIDVYHRIDALLARGVDVRLHVVAHDDRRSTCPAHWRAAGIEVFAHRRRGALSALSRKPYIVASRQVGSLLPNLANGAPVILFEGTHCTGWLGHPRLGDHAQWVRVHNVEADYYAELSASPATPGRRAYYREEARRLRGYETEVLAQADLLLPISATDEAWCEGVNPGRVLGHRGYSGARQVDIRSGLGEYVLFHGGLHIGDNAIAALSVAEALAKNAPGIPVVIAGRRPPPRLAQSLAAYGNARLVADPSREAMQSLIQQAQVAVLRAGHGAGFKIKLVESLALARHVAANEAMYRGARDLVSGVSTFEDDAQLAAAVKGVWGVGVDEAEVARRRRLLRPYLPEHLVGAFIERLRAETFKRN